jgi:hypothetical protein
MPAIGHLSKDARKKRRIKRTTHCCCFNKTDPILCPSFRILSQRVLGTYPKEKYPPPCRKYIPAERKLFLKIFSLLKIPPCRTPP